eukprot:scaffold307_cov390-Prasinococcus_capsulatus_cf.AAC.19
MSSLMAELLMLLVSCALSIASPFLRWSKASICFFPRAHRLAGPSNTWASRSARRSLACSTHCRSGQPQQYACAQ